MNMIPYVDNLIDRCSSSAPLRAASEWIRAWLDQLRRQETRAKLTLLMMIPPRLCATKIIGRCVVCRSQNRLQPLPMSKPLLAFSQGTDPTPAVLHGRIGIGS